MPLLWGATTFSSGEATFLGGVSFGVVVVVLEILVSAPAPPPATSPEVRFANPDVRSGCFVSWMLVVGMGVSQTCQIQFMRNLFSF